jgi:hypothetical protein
MNKQFAKQYLGIAGDDKAADALAEINGDAAVAVHPCSVAQSVASESSDSKRVAA